MGAYATCHAITREGYDQAIAGAEEFQTATEINPVGIDKAWHAVHYLLTSDTRSTLLLSGTQVPIVSEHCEVHRPESIREMCASLDAHTIDTLMTGFNVQRFDDLKIYPGPGWSDDAGPSFVRPALEAFVELLKRLNERNLGLMVVIA